jgi:hypothetical protein
MTLGPACRKPSDPRFSCWSKTRCRRRQWAGWLDAHSPGDELLRRTKENNWATWRMQDANPPRRTAQCMDQLFSFVRLSARLVKRAESKIIRRDSRPCCIIPFRPTEILSPRCRPNEASIAGANEVDADMAILRHANHRPHHPICHDWVFDPHMDDRVQRGLLIEVVQHS